jgi:hypothetical protein
MHNLGVKPAVRKATLARLASVEDQFREVERLSKQLRKRLDTIAETVRIAAEELNTLTGKNAARQRSRSGLVRTFRPQ